MSDEHDGMLKTAREAPSTEAMRAAVELEIQAALGRVTTRAIGEHIDRAIALDRATRPAVSSDPGDVLRYAREAVVQSYIKDGWSRDHAEQITDERRQRAVAIGEAALTLYLADHPEQASVGTAPCCDPSAYDRGECRGHDCQALAAAPQPPEATAPLRTTSETRVAIPQASRDPGRVAYEARFAHEHHSHFSAWSELREESRAVWRRVEAAVLATIPAQTTAPAPEPPEATAPSEEPYLLKATVLVLAEDSTRCRLEFAPGIKFPEGRKAVDRAIAALGAEAAQSKDCPASKATVPAQAAAPETPVLGDGGAGTGWSLSVEHYRRIDPILERLGQRAVATQKITDHDEASAAMREARDAITGLISEVVGALEAERRPAQALDLADLRGALGEPFMTANSGCGGRPFIRLQYEELRSMQRAQQSLVDLWRAAPAPDQTPPRGGVTAWRDMKTAPHSTPIVALHKPNDAMPHGWIATIERRDPNEEESRFGYPDQILHYNGDRIHGRFYGCWIGWMTVEEAATLSRQSPGAEPSAPTQPVGGVSVETIASLRISESKPGETVRELLREGYKAKGWGNPSDAADDTIEAILARIAAPAVATEQGWEPIETAPKDGTLIGVPGGVAYWRNDQWFTMTDEDWPGLPIQWTVLWWKSLQPPVPASPAPVDREA